MQRIDQPQIVAGVELKPVKSFILYGLEDLPLTYSG